MKFEFHFFFSDLKMVFPIENLKALAELFVCRMYKYLKNGEDIYEEYCKPSATHPSRPVMLPRAPQQKYIDVYPEDECFKDDKQRQSDYEAEVKVYRALEKLGEEMIVLHGFEYTHHQYRLCDRNHDRKSCQKCKTSANKDGECDFLVICNDRFVVIEVKNLEVCDDIVECEPEFHLCTIGEENDEPECRNHNEHLPAFEGTLKKSIKQRKKVVELIKNIDVGLNILEFTAYPNVTKQFKKERQHLETTSIIFREDLRDYGIVRSGHGTNSEELDLDDVHHGFRHWWKTHVHSFAIDHPKEESVSNYKKARNMLLAIWCSDKNSCDKQRCSLGWSVAQTYEKLRNGKFVFRKNNPNTVPAPRIIKEYLGVENLTTQQLDVLRARPRDNFLVIYGPAGAGKSLILAGRLIELVLNDATNKVVLIRFCARGKNLGNLYQKALDLAGIRNEEIFAVEGDSAFAVHKKITESMKSSQVTLVTVANENVSVTWFRKIVEYIRNCSLFIDDIQALVISTKTDEHRFIMNIVLEILISLYIFDENTICVACDVGQAGFSELLEAKSDLDYHTVRAMSHSSSKDRLVHLYFESFRVGHNFEAESPLTSLSSNLRNTANISTVLSYIRKICMQWNEVLGYHNHDHDDDFPVTPDKTLGHFIHGPQTVMHVFDCMRSWSPSVINCVIENEIKLLCKDGFIDLSDIGFIYNDHSAFSTLSNRISKSISTLHVNQSFSVEFPAVIVFHRMKSAKGYLGCPNIKELYLAMSRALVYCIIILFTPDRYMRDAWTIQLIPTLGTVFHAVRH